VAVVLQHLAAVVAVTVAVAVAVAIAAAVAVPARHSKGAVR